MQLAVAAINVIKSTANIAKIAVQVAPVKIKSNIINTNTTNTMIPCTMSIVTDVINVIM